MPRPSGIGDTYDAFDPQEPQPEQRARDIHNRIHRAQLVQVHLFDRQVVDAGLGLDHALENVHGRRMHLLRQTGGLDQRRDIG